MKIQALNHQGFPLEKASERKSRYDFAEVLWKKLREVDDLEKKAQEAILALARGEDIDPAEVAMRISQADNSMKLLLRVRNKVLEAYQEIMRMQI